MPLMRFRNASNDIRAWTVPGTLRYGTGGDDIEQSGGECGGYAPIVRNGIDKSGECVVVPQDGTDNSQTLATLLGLRSPVGLGNFTVAVDEVDVSWHALLSVSMEGAFATRLKIKWDGTVQS